MQIEYKEIVNRIIEESKKVNVQSIDKNILVEKSFSLNNNKKSNIIQKQTTTKKKKIPIVKNDRLPDKVVDFDNDIIWVQ